MITEELKTFIDKMRAAGKTDEEIASELKNSGWDEAAISRELLSKTSKKRLNLGKVKFWILVYGITVGYLYIESHDFWGLGSVLRSDPKLSSVVITFAFPVLPIFTLFAILSGLLTRRSFSIGYGWILVFASAISGAIMVSFWPFSSYNPYVGGFEESVLGGISLLGFFWLIFSLIFAVILIIIKKIRKTYSDSKQPKSKTLP